MKIYTNHLLFSCSVMSDSATPWTAACQAPLSSINSQSLLKLMSRGCPEGVREIGKQSESPGLRITQEPGWSYNLSWAIISLLKKCKFPFSQSFWDELPGGLLEQIWKTCALVHVLLPSISAPHWAPWWTLVCGLSSTPGSTFRSIRTLTSQ